MKKQKNTTAPFVSERATGSLANEAMKKYYSKTSTISFKDDTISKRHEELLDRFPAKDIGDIRKLEKFLDSYSYSEIPMTDMLELSLEKDITPTEVSLLEVLFKNKLRTASRNGITVLDIDGSLEIRNEKDKFLSHEETDKFKRYLTEEDEDRFKYQGYGIANNDRDTKGVLGQSRFTNKGNIQMLIASSSEEAGKIRESLKR